MNNKGPNPYLRTKVMTASPTELRLMLYEGAIKFAQQGREALGKKDYESSYNALMRAQKIVLELSTSLNHDAAPDLCDKLSALYTFIYRKLVDANMHRQTEPLEEAIGLLEYEKETWQMLMKQLPSGADGSNPAAPNPENIAGAQQTAISSLSTNA
jgi:flagellar protein FliS